MRGTALEKVIRKDIENGFIPFFIVATLGTTNSCAFDCLDEIGAVGNDLGAWVHVDAAYAGSAFICPEYQPLMKGIGNGSSDLYKIALFILLIKPIS